MPGGTEVNIGAISLASDHGQRHVFFDENIHHAHIAFGEGQGRSITGRDQIERAGNACNVGDRNAQRNGERQAQ